MNFVWNALHGSNEGHDQYVEQYQKIENPKISLYEFLGFRKKDYQAWYVNKDVLVAILSDLKKGPIGINQIVNDETKEFMYLIDTADDASSFSKIITDGVFTVYYQEHPSGVITSANGSVSRWQNGQLHHDTLPAITNPNGMRAYYQEGKLHRKNGPAFKYPDYMVEKRYIFFLNGVQQKKGA